MILKILIPFFVEIIFRVVKHIIYYIIFLSAFLGNSQNKDAEIIQKILDSVYKSSLNPDSLLSSSDKIFKIIGNSKELDSLKLHAHKLRSIAFMLNQKNDSFNIELEKMMTHFKNDTLLIKKMPELYCSTIGGASNKEREKGNYAEAYNLLTNALKVIDSSDFDNIASLNSGLALLNHTMGYDTEAEKLIRKTLKLKKISNLSTNLLHLDLGYIYRKRNIDSAFYFFKKSEPYFKKANKQTYYKIQSSIASVLIKRGELSKAKSLLEEVEVYALKHDITSLGETYLLLSEIASINGDLKKEYEFLKRADKYIINSYYLIEKQDLFEKYADFYVKVKDFKKKNEYELKTLEIKDRINNRERIFLTKELEVKYATAFNKNKISNQALLIKAQNRQNGWLIGGLILLTCLLGIVIFLYRQRILTQKKLITKQEELSLEKVTNLIETQKVKTYESHLKGQNKERKRIAKDLHDSVSGNLAAIKMKLTDIAINQSKEIEAIIASIDTTYNEVRTISHNLSPQNDIKQNFVDTLNQLMLLYNSKTITFKMDVFPEKDLNDLPQVIQIEVYRVLQELITNIVKHAKASNGLINITLHDDYLNLIVEDDGIGYDVVAKKQGIGLQNITSRIKSISGTLDVDSVKEKGTTVNISIPI